MAGVPLCILMVALLRSLLYDGLFVVRFKDDGHIGEPLLLLCLRT